jgi:hypothetical protein
MLVTLQMKYKETQKGTKEDDHTAFLPWWSDISRAFCYIPSLSKQINKRIENINLQAIVRQFEKQYVYNGGIFS